MPSHRSGGNAPQPVGGRPNPTPRPAAIKFSAYASDQLARTPLGVRLPNRGIEQAGDALIGGGKPSGQQG